MERTSSTITLPSGQLNPSPGEKKANINPLLKYWADKDPGKPGEKSKVESTRSILSRLLLKSDIDGSNQFLLESTPWGKPGSSYRLNKKGDYDFTEIMYAMILSEFAYDTSTLYPQTASHIAYKLIVEKPGRWESKTPRTLGIMQDTENHILMRNVSNFLRNQWVFEQDNSRKKYDNSANGCKTALKSHLEEMIKTGFYEFNSIPYAGYTFSALLILHKYSHDREIKTLCTNLLDQEFWKYSMSSSHFRFSAPFRRRLERFGIPALNADYPTALMKCYDVLASGGVVSPDRLKKGLHHVLKLYMYYLM